MKLVKEIVAEQKTINVSQKKYDYKQTNRFERTKMTRPDQTMF